MDVGLLSAAGSGHLELIDFFLEKGADDIKIAVNAAVRFNQKEALGYLLAKVPAHNFVSFVQERWSLPKL